MPNTTAQKFAFMRGWDARCNEQNKDTCPYTQPEFKRQWLDGWNQSNQGKSLPEWWDTFKDTALAEKLSTVKPPTEPSREISAMTEKELRKALLILAHHGEYKIAAGLIGWYQHLMELLVFDPRMAEKIIGVRLPGNKARADQVAALYDMLRSTVTE